MEDYSNNGMEHELNNDNALTLFNQFKEIALNLLKEKYELKACRDEAETYAIDLEKKIEQAENLLRNENKKLLAVSKEIDNVKFTLKKAKVMIDFTPPMVNPFALPRNKTCGVSELKKIFQDYNPDFNDGPYLRYGSYVPSLSGKTTQEPCRQKRTKLTREQLFLLTDDDFSVEKLLASPCYENSPSHDVRNSSGNRAADKQITNQIPPAHSKKEPSTSEYQTHNTYISPLLNTSLRRVEKSKKKSTDSGSTTFKVTFSPRKRTHSPNNSSTHVLKRFERVRPQLCIVCHNKLEYARHSFECTSCNITVHSTCTGLMPPCMQRPITIGKIENLVAGQKPMVPVFIVKCINMIEERGIKGSNIYRVPSSPKEVNAILKEKLKVKGKINVTNVSNTHTLCGCVVEFVKNLEEPLIGLKNLQQFKNATFIGNKHCKEERLLTLLQHLAPPNRDTLVFILLHFKRVIFDSNWSRKELAKFFAPYIMNYRVADAENIPLGSTNNNYQLLNELISLPSELLTKLLIPDEETANT